MRNIRTRLLLSVVALLAFSWGASAQQTAQASTEGKVIDSVMYRITYMTQSVKDTTQLDEHHHYKYGTDEMRLDIGRHLNYFYSYTQARHDSAFHAEAHKLDAGGVLRGSKLPKGSITWRIYQNYPEGQTSFLDDNYVVLAEYRVNEKTVQPQWSIVSDSVATILGYRCTLATTQFKGRKWLAWYTEDIPLNFGPWKLCGLPGLILRAYDSQRQYIFEAAGMSQPNGAEPIREVKNIKKYETLSLKDYLKALHEVTPGESLAALGIKIEGGDEEWQKDFDKFTKNVAPSNPIKTEE